jgi:thiol:disulfide interchange protein DsbD
METFKQAMAFPLYLTVVWLVWVLARQGGVDAVPAVLAGLVLIALACWLLAHRGVVGQGLRYAALVAAIALLFVPALHAPDATAAAPAAKPAHERYSDQRLAELRAQGHAVFVNLTADWCLTCKFNERAALGTPAVRAAMARHGVVSLVGDWTRSDPAITAVLQRFDRAGVPLYLLYGPTGDPVVLPQLLTPATVVEEIEKVS